MEGKVIRKMRCASPARRPRIGFEIRYMLAAWWAAFLGEHTRGSRYAVLAADIAGHGVSSALYTMQSRPP
jgi:hypothetical protein